MDLLVGLVEFWLGGWQGRLWNCERLDRHRFFCQRLCGKGFWHRERRGRRQRLRDLHLGGLRLGSFLVDHQVVETLPPLSPRSRLWLGRLLTFHVVCLGWVFFRAPTLSEAFAVLDRLVDLGTGQGINLVMVATIAVFLGTQFVPSDAVGRAQARFSRLPAWQQGALLALFLVFTSALSPTGVAPFIYFAF